MADNFKIGLMSEEGVSYRSCDAAGVHEELRQIGLEWKTADWAHGQQVVITIAPHVEENNAGLREQVRQAADLLERTGLL